MSSAAGWRGYAKAIVAGLLIAAAGIIPFTLIAPLNRTVRPDVPWAAVVTTAYLAVLLAWLHGWGWPRKTSEQRRRRLRLWPPSPHREGVVDSLTVPVILLLLGLLTAVWVLVGRLSGVPDLSAFPTTSYRWSMFLMGGLLAGVVEEAAYRGYMQTGLEQHDPDSAVVVTSIVFAASHVTHGLQAVLVLGPGFFAASMLYGALARRTGTILPGMVIHTAGDLAYMFFGVLRGEGSLLFVS